MNYLIFCLVLISTAFSSSAQETTPAAANNICIRSAGLGDLRDCLNLEYYEVCTHAVEVYSKYLEYPDMPTHIQQCTQFNALEDIAFYRRLLTRQ